MTLYVHKPQTVKLRLHVVIKHPDIYVIIGRYFKLLSPQIKPLFIGGLYVIFRANSTQYNFQLLTAYNYLIKLFPLHFGCDCILLKCNTQKSLIMHIGR